MLCYHQMSNQEVHLDHFFIQNSKILNFEYNLQLPQPPKKIKKNLSEQYTKLSS